MGRIKQYALDKDDRMAVYLPHGQATTRAMYVTVRGDGDPELLDRGRDVTPGERQPAAQGGQFGVIGRARIEDRPGLPQVAPIES